MNRFISIASADIEQDDALTVDDAGKLRPARNGEAYFCHAPESAKKGERVTAEIADRVEYVSP